MEKVECNRVSIRESNPWNNHGLEQDFKDQNHHSELGSEAQWEPVNFPQESCERLGGEGSETRIVIQNWYTEMHVYRGSLDPSSASSSSTELLVPLKDF